MNKRGVLIFWIIIFLITTYIASATTYIGRSKFNANDCYIKEDSTKPVRLSQEEACEKCAQPYSAIHGCGANTECISSKGNDLLHDFCQSLPDEESEEVDCNAFSYDPQETCECNENNCNPANPETHTASCAENVCVKEPKVYETIGGECPEDPVRKGDQCYKLILRPFNPSTEEAEGCILQESCECVEWISSEECVSTTDPLYKKCFCFGFEFEEELPELTCEIGYQRDPSDSNKCIYYGNTETCTPMSVTSSTELPSCVIPSLGCGDSINCEYYSGCECVAEFKRLPGGYNSATCQRRAPGQSGTCCDWINADFQECLDYEIKNGAEGSHSCVDDRLYQNIPGKCGDCNQAMNPEKRYNADTEICELRSQATYCEWIESANDCDCIAPEEEQDCNNELLQLCGFCETESCQEGVHRSYFNADNCGIYELNNNNRCEFQSFEDTIEYRQCLNKEGTDLCCLDGSSSCTPDPLKIRFEDCEDVCVERYFRSHNAYDCTLKNSDCTENTNVDVINCLGVDGSNDCTDPIYRMFGVNKEQCNVNDDDNDGVDDLYDDCKGTNPDMVVDAYGCSCNQKICDDKNECTDDVCNPNTAGCESIIDNTNTCGTMIDCPENVCDNQPPHENMLIYPESGYASCQEGVCVEESCAVLSIEYSTDCDLDDDNDGDPDETDPDKDNPAIYTGAEEICDGLDNDGNGQIDGITFACPLQEGVCKGSTQTCNNGNWEGCYYGANYVNTETTSYCDNLDNDCDGSKDEGCECSGSQTKYCGSDTGECKTGTQQCNKGNWGDCLNAISPKQEICNGLDDDCDNLIDENEYDAAEYTLQEECWINSCQGIKTCTSNTFSECVLNNDYDFDSVCLEIDNCPGINNPTQEDSDGDNIGDACDACPFDPLNDVDQDSICDDIDNCLDIQNTDQIDSDSDGKGDMCDICSLDPLDDEDFDNVCGDIDNCPDRHNPTQNDCDNDNIGDACDFDSLCSIDSDNDGIKDNIDNCVSIQNPYQTDYDGDDIGNICDDCVKDQFNDIDRDNVCGDVDNCPDIDNKNQLDKDSDGKGDKCDLCPNDKFNDLDSDNICGNLDNCPTQYNPTQSDCDNDNIGDACDFDSLCSTDSDKDDYNDNIDNCINYYNPDQMDSDNDNIGDACDICPKDSRNDGDKDGVCDDLDNCVNIKNHAQKDKDKDGIGDLCDTCPDDKYNDLDQDNVCGDIDNCPKKSNPSQVDCENNKIGDACDLNSLCVSDTDGDNINDNFDNCPESYNLEQFDKDGDGIGDLCDLCEKDAFNDLDNDGICGNKDNCPSISNQNQRDTDKDNRGDACDRCVYDPENDRDSDGVCGDFDNCRYTYNPTQVDCENNNIGDACDINSRCVKDKDDDGVVDYNDNCADLYNPRQIDSDLDGTGDKCDICIHDKYNDIDYDSICGNEDNCPLIYNPGQNNVDNDIMGDACDLCPLDENNDYDGDGICNDIDTCPDKYNPNQEQCGDIIDEDEIYDEEINLITGEQDVNEILELSQTYENESKKDIFDKFEYLKDFIKIEKKEYYNNNKLFTKYKITIESDTPINDFSYYQNLPKCLSEKAENIYFNGKNYQIIENDPLIAWHFTEITNKIELIYEVEGKVSEECIQKIKEFAYAPVEEKKATQPWKIIASIFVILIVIGMVIFLQKHNPEKNIEKNEL